jgi:Spy/CpxP family protein refolding chaperone
MTAKFKPWLFLAMIFVAGIMTGVALTIGLASHFMHPPGMQQMKSRWMAHLVEKLNLTSDQQAKIEPILTDAENQLQAARRENIDKVSQIFQKANAEIATILTPDQQVALDKMIKEMESHRDQMFQGHMHEWGAPHGGPDGPGMPPGPPPPPGH